MAGPPARLPHPPSFPGPSPRASPPPPRPQRPAFFPCPSLGSLLSSHSSWGSDGCSSCSVQRQRSQLHSGLPVTSAAATARRLLKLCFDRFYCWFVPPGLWLETVTSGLCCFAVCPGVALRGSSVPQPLTALCSHLPFAGAPLHEFRLAQRLTALGRAGPFDLVALADCDLPNLSARRPDWSPRGLWAVRCEFRSGRW